MNQNDASWHLDGTKVCWHFVGMKKKRSMHGNCNPFNFGKSGKRIEWSTDDACLAASEKQKTWFWAKVTKTDAGCWLFSKVNEYGYGRTTVNYKTVHAHRASLIWDKGKPESGMLASHKCRNRNCVNPRHLRWANAKQNIGDKVSDGTNKPWSHCGERHPRALICDKTAIAIYKAYADGNVSMREVAQSFQVNAHNVRAIAEGRNWADVTHSLRAKLPLPASRGRKRGVNAPNAKLSASQVLDVRHRIKTGETFTAIARSMNVSRPTVTNIMRGKSHKT